MGWLQCLAANVDAAIVVEVGKDVGQGQGNQIPWCVEFTCLRHKCGMV